MLKVIRKYVESLQPSVVNWIVVMLLLAILITQVLILLRMPSFTPTVRMLRNAKTYDEFQQILDGIPLVWVHGGDIRADIAQTVDVEVINTPLEVQLYR